MSRFKSALFAAMLVTLLVVVPAFAQDNVVHFSSYQSDPVPRAITEQWVADWNAANPDLQVELSTVAHEDFKTAIRTYLVAEPAPDVLTWFAGNRARFFIDRGLIMDFSDVWEANNLDDVYAPVFTALATYDDGKYFLPTSYYWWAIYYRKSLFEEVGVEAPIETWDELLAACDAFDAAGKRLFAIGTRFRWPAAGWFDYLNMRTNGPEFHTRLMDLQESYTDDRVKQTFAHWAELLEHNCFIDDPAAYDWQGGVQFMVDGTAGAYLMGQFILNEYPDELEGDLDFFRFPIINPDVPIGEDAPTDGFFIAANTDNPEGAKEFLMYLGSQEVQQRAFDENATLPTRTDVDISGADEATQKGIALIQSADVVTQFYDRDTPEEMYVPGMDAMVAFMDDPSLVDELLEGLEIERARLAELAAEEE